MRALLERAKVQIQSVSYRLLNQDEKTVVRLVYQAICQPPGPPAALLAAQFRLQPVRGYPDAAQDLANRLQEMGLAPVERDEPFLMVLAAVGLQPGDYSSKLNLQLKPEMRADEAVQVILRVLLDVLKQNEPYLKQDIDTEFLHDFRVAVRRTRSALTQLGEVLPVEITEHFKQEFADIGQLSNQLRDLDVYLLKQTDYRAMLPDLLRDDIQPLFDYLRAKRVKALQEVIAGLNSEQYSRLLEEWKAFLHEPLPFAPAIPKADRPIIELARPRIYKRYRRIVKSGRRILSKTEDELLHALRIECKKLRYLMEFFTSLFPPKQINRLIKQLKQLQDNLGDFNDLHIQEEYLLRVAAELPLSDPQARQTILAIGSLIGALDQERQQVKSAFAQTFNNFASSANKKLFKELFT